VQDTRRTRVVLIVLLVAALALIALSYSDSSAPGLRDIRMAGGTVFGGAEHAVSSVAGFVTGSDSSAATQVKSLQGQVGKLRAELSQAQLSKSEYAQLHKLLQIAGAAQFRVVAAQVIAVGQGYQQTVTLDAGSNDGIKAQETVLNGAGLVGVVTSVTPSTATVRLSSDASTVVGVQVAPSGQLGWVSGAGPADGGDGLMRLQMLSSAAVLKPGDQLVTSASVKDHPYVPGVPVGVITKLVDVAGSLTAVALVRPYASFTALGVVGVVIVPPRHNPRFSALPPLPHPGPTVTVTVQARPAKPGGGATPNPATGG
jgi:rod shape-determining protein MreC